MASPSEVPPLNEIFLIGIWVETALWGISTVLFSSVYFVLFRRYKPNSSCWVLAITSLSMYLCVTLHVSASLRQGLEAFIYVPPDAEPDCASLYFAQEGSTFAAMKNILYGTAVFLQDLVLIWRMYVVWECRWQVVVLPLIIELAHTGCAYAGAILLTRPDIGIYSPIQSTLGFLSWLLEVVVNVGVAGAIILRLWYTGYAVSRTLSGTESRLGLSKDNSLRYLGSMIFIIVESGAIIVAVSITMLALYKTGHPAALMCLDIATQIAALVPYLIILRVGLRPECVTQSSTQVMNRNPFDRDGMRVTPSSFLESRSGASPRPCTATECSERESINCRNVSLRIGSQGSLKELDVL
ncbi:hypothetical protein V8D89_008932 [Ganoderma adspersum]